MRPQARGSGGQEPHPSWEGQAPLIPVSLDTGEGIWCGPGPWDSKRAGGSGVQVLVGEGPVGGGGQQSLGGGQQRMVEPSRRPGGGSWSFAGI